MEELRNLNELAKQVVQNFNEKFDARDCVIPQAFKDKVKRLKTFSVVYNDYSVIIKGDGVRSKDSYVPNQSFFMASFFIEYSYELSRYKQKIMSLISDSGISTNDLTAFFTHERDKGKEDIKINEDKFVKILDDIGYSGSDRNYLIKFVTDYDWWSGSKTIDRSDFFNSPVLYIMGLTASSNAAMALIVDHLTQNPGLSNLLLNQINVGSNSNMDNGNLQQIFYGAPGTGKSNTIKKQTAQAEKEGKVFRTTFHPDSDYSTFVGCYKPSMTSSARVLSPEELTIKLKEIKTTGTTYPCHKFAAKYWESLNGLSTETIKQILNACGFTDNYTVEIAKGAAIGQEYLNNPNAGKIIYSFTPQAFTNAYVKAWNTKEDVYLIIEEINRGNCAQIFGDLFQLLDRKDGVSEYPIDSDTDLRNYLSTELAKSTRDDFPEGVKEGKKLVLPKNLYIWATMNTSDQSLFPIDSAFKRRWDWVYIPIKDHVEEDYKIDIDGAIYSWWGFLEKINYVIGKVTSSEDKKLGYFFVKAPNKVVDAKKFVGKVLFYLWNDVFKNYGFENAIFSRAENKKFEFSDFFDKKGEPETTVVNEFLKKLDETIDKEHSFISIDNGGSPSSLIINYNGETIEGDSAVSKYIEFINRVIKDKDIDEVADCLGADMTQTPPDNTTRKFRPIGDSGWYLATNIGTGLMKDNINEIKKLGVDVVIE